MSRPTPTKFVWQGILTKLKKRWWEVTGEGACSAVVGGGDKMSVAALAGLFMMLIGGMVSQRMVVMLMAMMRKGSFVM